MRAKRKIVDGKLFLTSIQGRLKAVIFDEGEAKWPESLEKLIDGRQDNFLRNHLPALDVLAS